MMTRTLATTLSIMLLASLTLTACGRKGDPLPPSLARANADAARQGEPDTTATDKVEVEDRRFVLDPLLD
jgi:predicted small lipoprotein YifL